MSDSLYKAPSLTPKRQKSHHCDKIYTCKRCSFNTKQFTAITHHAKFAHRKRGPLDPFQCTRNPPEPYRCYYCDFKTALIVKYNEHVEKTKHGTGSNATRFVPNYLCEKCKFETYSRLLLLKHVYTSCSVDRAKAILMLVCLRGASAENRIKLLYGDPLTLRASAIKKQPPKPIQPSPKRARCKEKKAICDKCGQETPNSTSLKTHMILKHTAPEDIEWFHCPHCPHKAKVRAHHTQHISLKHTNKDKMFKCEMCSFRHMCRKSVRRHFKLVHADGAGVEWFRCKFCPYKSRSKNHWKRHEREQHQGDFKMLECEFCPYRARQKIHMKLHMTQKHTPDSEVQWFSCHHCDYKAKLKASLKAHLLKKHTSSEMIDWFVCDKCGFKALERFLLKNHMEKKH